jgi:hypothetical protein
MMKIGMLWFDNNPKTTLETKIQAATDYYKIKYGLQATTIFVNPADMHDEKIINGFNIRPNSSILPCHIWVGTE